MASVSAPASGPIHLVFVTSMIHRADSDRDSDRLSRLVSTLQNVSAVLRPCYRVVVEMSALTDAETSRVREWCDRICDMSVQPMTRLATSNKSVGETFGLCMAAAQFLDRPPIPESSIGRVFKLTGRYTLDPARVAPDSFPDSKLTCRKFSNGWSSWYATAFYCMGSGSDAVRRFRDVLTNSVVGLCLGSFIDVEHAFFALVPADSVCVRDTMGMSGIMPNGEWVDH